MLALAPSPAAPRLSAVAIVTLLACAFIGADAQAAIVGVAPLAGSLLGGTEVTISGSGFSRDGIAGTTTVYFGNDECVQIAYYSTDEQIVCLSPPHAVSESVPISVVIVQVNTAFTATNGNKYKFSYGSWYTPSLTSFPMAAAAGMLFSFTGTMFYVSPDFVTPKKGQCLCNMGNTVNLNSNPVVQYSGTAYCLVTNQEAGPVQFSLTLWDSYYGYGLASYSPWLQQVSAIDGSTYNFVQHPDITGLSVSTGGLLGGGPLTITGSGFSYNSSNVVVLVAGSPFGAVVEHHPDHVHSPCGLPSQGQLLLPGRQGPAVGVLEPQLHLQRVRGRWVLQPSCAAARIHPDPDGWCGWRGRPDFRLRLPVVQ